MFSKFAFQFGILQEKMPPLPCQNCIWIEEKKLQEKLIEQPIATHLLSGRYLTLTTPSLGRSEKYQSWNLQKSGVDSEPRHSTDFRTVFGITIGRFVLC